MLLALNIPGAPEALRAVFDYFPFLYGPGIGSHMLWFFLHVVTLPFAIIMIARYMPVSIPLKNDYSYGIYVFAWPAQQITIFYLLKWAFPLHPLAVFAIRRRDYVRGCLYPVASGRETGHASEGSPAAASRNPALERRAEAR